MVGRSACVGEDSQKPCAGAQGKRLIIDRPFAETKEQYCFGFIMVEADTSAKHLISPPAFRWPKWRLEVLRAIYDILQGDGRAGS